MRWSCCHTQRFERKRNSFRMVEMFGSASFPLTEIPPFKYRYTIWNKNNKSKSYSYTGMCRLRLELCFVIFRPSYVPTGVKCLSMQLVQALRFLHSHNVTHRDIKPVNVLLTQQGVLKLIGFGWSMHFSSSTNHFTPDVVTLWYRSPDLLSGCHSYGTKADIWAVCCVFSELILADPLLPGTSEVE